jgi:hypothetical protein
LYCLVALFFTARIGKQAVAAGKHPRLGVVKPFGSWRMLVSRVRRWNLVAMELPPSALRMAIGKAVELNASKWKKSIAPPIRRKKRMKKNTKTALQR